MSPRGGRTSGGSSSGGTRYSDGEYSEHSVWKESSQLAGSHFTDGRVVASIVFNFLCLVALISIAIWSTRIKTKAHLSLKVFGWFGLGIALTASLTLWTLSIINSFLGEFEVEVSNLYIIMDVLLVFLGCAADLSLIVVIFTIISFRVKPFYTVKVQNGLVIFRCLTLSTQIALLIALLTYYILGAVKSVEGDTLASYYFERYAHFLAGFHIVFFLITMVVFVNSIIIFVQSRKISIPSVVPIRILLLIASPLLLRSFVALVLACLLNIAEKPIDYQNVDLIQTILLMIPAVVIFGGILLIGLHPDLSSLDQIVLDAAFTTPAQAILPGLGSRTTLASLSDKKDDDQPYAEFAHPMPPPEHAERYKLHRSKQSWTEPLAWNQTPPLPQPHVFEAPDSGVASQTSPMRMSPARSPLTGGQLHEAP